MISAKSLLLLSVLSATPSVELWEFTAPWCGSCRQMAPVVRQLKSAGVAIKQIQFDQNKQLAAQAEVRSLPCFLVVSEGQILSRHEGTASFDQLLGLVQQGTQAQRGTQAQPQGGRTRASVAHGQPADDDAAVVRGQTEPANRKMLGRAVSAISDRFAKHRCRQCGATANCQCVPHQGSSQAQPSPNMLAQVQHDYRNEYAVAAANHTPASPPDLVLNERTIQQALSATVRLRVKDQQGVSLGTGTVIDVHDNEALVLTCGHIFRDSEGKGEISCDFFGSDKARNIPGKLISYDMRRDVGLVSFRPGVPVQPSPIGGTGCGPKENDQVFSIGCNHGEDPTTNRNRILAVNRYHGPANIVVGGRPVDGRSGGGLFNRKGQLIGVCNAADQEEDEGLYAALGPIHAELDSAGLSFIYRPRQPSIATAPSDTPPTGQINSEYLAPKQSSPGSPGENDPRANSGAAIKQARLATPQQADDTEVICILRSRNPQNQQGTAFVLEHPSAELIAKLSQEMSKRGPHLPTQHHRQLHEEPLPQTPANNWEHATHLR